MTQQPQPPAGIFDEGLHRFPVRVYYEDTDLSGIVYHANYLRWFERARSDMLRLLGIDQRSAVETGEGAYAVADLSLRYLAPARLDDVIIVCTVATELKAASVRLTQRAFREETLLAEAHIRVGFVAPDGRPRRQPKAWRQAFETLTLSKDPA
ncbi:tol-pal system-associated acyl-CoA thioesterase [Altericroceibacterium endophyticum]|uniref:Tol-pal system-associated acyl-CoA thioesterase n=1 Tax=Altericroceibacterium endophyticum TaxID=1808508 RepID=A0A6I4T844_9SPHN|nr:tol-pal system-associated acyl-CoA thioesterase [Altericroceibacterium endophyticum]MXO66947.1 tol-pal system-associated acyl-CoA thioesterase [Altericroceibacterium endophyticum]